MTLSNLEFTADFSVNPPVASNLQVTIDSATTTPITVTGNSIYQGVAVVIVRNFNWDGNAREVVTSATSANSNFLLLRGPPSFNYVVTRQSDNDLDFSRTAVPTAPPAPTQSVTPNPAVSGAVSNSVAFLSIFVSFAIYFIFN